METGNEKGSGIWAVRHLSKLTKTGGKKRLQRKGKKAETDREHVV